MVRSRIKFPTKIPQRKTAVAAKNDSNTPQNIWMLKLREIRLINEIPLSPDRTDRMTILWVIPELAPDIPDVYHDRIIGRVKIGFFPDDLIDFLSRKDFLWMGRKQQKDPVFRIRQRHLLPILAHDTLF